MQEVEEDTRTYITHNKGAKWELIQAPTITSKGVPINCHIQEHCSLHLEIYSHISTLPPVYSTTSAVGIILATGNLGRRLTGPETNKNLYISRDGGSKWRSVKPGQWIYEIGDHGALIVVAKKNEPTTDLEFSLDEGLTWEKVKISDHPIFVHNIIIEPKSVSQQFLVHGVYE